MRARHTPSSSARSSSRVRRRPRRAPQAHSATQGVGGQGAYAGGQVRDRPVDGRAGAAAQHSCSRGPRRAEGVADHRPRATSCRSTFSTDIHPSRADLHARNASSVCSGGRRRSGLPAYHSCALTIASMTTRPARSGRERPTMRAWRTQYARRPECGSIRDAPVAQLLEAKCPRACPSRRRASTRSPSLLEASHCRLHGHRRRRLWGPLPARVDPVVAGRRVGRVPRVARRPSCAGHRQRPRCACHVSAAAAQSDTLRTHTSLASRSIPTRDLRSVVSSRGVWPGAPADAHCVCKGLNDTITRRPCRQNGPRYPPWADGTVSYQTPSRGPERDTTAPEASHRRLSTIPCPHAVDRPPRRR